jgi:hypothetical protein
MKKEDEKAVKLAGAGDGVYGDAILSWFTGTERLAGLKSF